MKNLTEQFVLSNGYKVPCIGYGTWRVEDGEVATLCVRRAIELGYRHIDTAAYYGNEKSVGEGIKASKVKREDVFITSKLWNMDRGYEKTMVAFEKTLSNLQLDYLDLYLMHWPASSSQFEDWEKINLETWRAITELYKAGKIKAIGVSNFLPHHLKALMETEVKPMVNQIEFHPGYMQEETLQYCRQNNILVEAWSPLGRGRVLEHALLVELAKKYNKSVAQICIRWCLQNGVVPLPKSVTDSRILANKEVFDFEISNEDMVAINTMPLCGESGLHPDTITF